MNDYDIIELIKHFKSSNLNYLEITSENIKLKARKSLSKSNTTREVKLPATIEDEICCTLSSSKIKIKSELVGIIQLEDSSGTPFVKINSEVKKKNLICIVHHLKTQNEILSGFDGIISKILVRNNQIVEYGQVLFEITC